MRMLPRWERKLSARSPGNIMFEDPGILKALPLLPIDCNCSPITIHIALAGNGRDISPFITDFGKVTSFVS